MSGGPSPAARTLEGLRVLVTGASSGIGRATALALAANGACVVATGRRRNALHEVRTQAEAAGGKVVSIAGDLGDAEFIEELVRAAGPVDVLVNNAGSLVYLPLLDVSAVDAEAMFRVNVLAALSLTQAIARQMAQRRNGHIVFITSLAARNVNRFGVVYAATKHALSAIAKGARLELKAAGIKVTEVAPGMVDTPIRDASTHPDVVASIKSRTFAPLTAEDVARAVVYAVGTGSNCSPDLIELRPTPA